MAARLLIRIESLGSPLPYTYRYAFATYLHSCLGPANRWHEGLSLYSIGSLKGGRGGADGIATWPGQMLRWQVGAWENDFLLTLLDGILQQPKMPFGLIVRELRLELAPNFEPQAYLIPESPILLRTQRPDNTTAHVLYSDPAADALLTRSLRGKLEKAGLHSLAKQALARFDRSHHSARAKVLEVKNIRSRGSLCPVVVEGPHEAAAMAWAAGLGHSTGVGFGAMR